MDEGPSPAEHGDDVAGTVSWGELLNEASSRFEQATVVEPAISARRIVEEAAGVEPSELALALTSLATERGVAHFDAMVARRLQGEPLQYVVGRWGFRQLDLFVDRRVLIPRPETEQVAGWALDELPPPSDRTLVAVDLGTGSGAIGLSLLVERSDVEVWLTDASPDALAVAGANLTGLGRAGVRGRLAAGDWYDALPNELRQSAALVVANPPYVAADDELPDEVRRWEPTAALISGPTGYEALDVVVAGAAPWLDADGSLVIELSPDQVERVADRASDRFAEVEVRADLAGRRRAVIARRPRT